MVDLEPKIIEFEEARRLLQAENQLHVLTFWNVLSASEQRLLLSDISAVNWGVIREAIRTRSAPLKELSFARMTPPAAIRTALTDDPDATGRRLREIGERLLRDERVAALTVAGGQGTRLGSCGPKGALPITPVRQKSLFQHFAEAIRATNRRYGCDVPWHIMTSPENHTATQTFFDQHDFFGLARPRVAFFEQGTMPTLSLDGKLLLAERHRLALAPDGHGGVLAALRRCGCLDRLIQEGREYISFFQVDNPLIGVCDPGFLGAVHETGSEAGSKAVQKRDEREKAGVFALDNGDLRVIEYSVLPETLACQREADGSLKFGLANIAAHVFSVSFIDRLTRGETGLQLPWNRACKKIAHIELETGQRSEPSQPDAIKLEQFIFDSLPMARNPIIYEVRREEEFSPVKNATGEDSPETARADLSQRARAWLVRCGKWPADADPEAVEISPLFALDAEELRSRLETCPETEGRSQLYLGP